MTASSGNLLEDSRREDLKNVLTYAWDSFDIYEEVSLRHAMFRHRSVRADLVAVPHGDEFSDCVLAFEVKGHPEWDVPSLTHALKQASDYVYAPIEPGQNHVPKQHWGKRVIGAFVFPFFSERNKSFGVSSEDAFLMGMMQSAGAYRVGSASRAKMYGRMSLVLSIASTTLWCDGKGWRQTSLPVLTGKRQIGSQRVNILDELARMN